MALSPPIPPIPSTAPVVPLPTPEIDSTGVPDVVVWEADGTVDGRVGYGAAIAARLRIQGLDVALVPLTRRRPDERELAAGRHVLSGGNTAVTADVAWLVDVRRVLQPLAARAVAGAVEVTGICFGAQLLATLLAGPEAVGPHPEGMQAGLIDVEDGDGQVHAVSSYHYHHIDHDRLLAAGATVTMTGGRTPVQAYRAGRGLRGVQFHPELVPDALAGVIELHRHVVEATGGSPRRSLASIEARRARWDERPWASLMAGSPGLGAEVAAA